MQGDGDAGDRTSCPGSLLPTGAGGHGARFMPPGTARCLARSGGGGPYSAEPSAALAALPARPAPGCLASFPRRPGTNCFPRRGETGRDTCAPSAAAPSAGALRVPAIAVILSRIQHFLPLSSPLALARGWILFLPSRGGGGGGGGPRCARACSARASCRREGRGAPRHSRAFGSHRAGTGTAEPAPIRKHRAGDPQRPPSRRLLGGRLEGAGVAGRRPPPLVLPV